MKEFQKVRRADIKTGERRFEYRLDPSFSGKRSLYAFPIFWRDGGDLIPVVLPSKLSSHDTEEIDALVYISGVSYEDVLKDMIGCEEVLNIFEISAVISLLDTWSPTYNKKTWSRILGIGEGQWDDIRPLISYDADWKRYLVQKHVPLKRVLSFASAQLRQTLQPLLALNPGINVLESIADLLSGIAQRDKCAIPEIFTRCDIPALLQHPELNPAECLRSVQQRLFAERFPLIADFRQRMDAHLKSIHTPPGIRLGMDPFFEAPGLEIHVRVEKKEDIGILLHWLQDKEEELNKVMDIQTGDDPGE
jgi:hypothetical protein